GNMLDGGSGNDTLVVLDGTGNAFYGGSGNDLMIGYAEDYFDGGSGKNVIEHLTPVSLQELWLSGPDNGLYAIGGAVFTSEANGTILVSLYDSNSDWVSDLSGTFTVDESGIFFA